MSENKGPKKKFRVGNMTASVWENTIKKDGKETSYQTVSLQRSYKDKDGNWKNTDSMRNNDVPKAQLALSKAYEYMFTKESEEDSD